MLEWMQSHDELLYWLGIGSAVMFVASLLAIPVLVSRIPADYFAQRKAPPTRWQRLHPYLRVVLRVVKNVVGGVLIVMGIVMLVLPGQGVITILIGVMFLEFPGKRRMELAIVRQPKVLAALNWLRRKTGHEPLRVAGVAPEPIERPGADHAQEGESPR